MVKISSCSVSSTWNSIVLVAPLRVRRTPRRSTGPFATKKVYACFAVCAAEGSIRSSRVSTAVANSATLVHPNRLAIATLASRSRNFCLSNIPIGAGNRGVEFFGWGKGAVLVGFLHVSNPKPKSKPLA